jgi:hypothetical protein
VSEGGKREWVAILVRLVAAHTIMHPPDPRQNERQCDRDEYETTDYNEQIVSNANTCETPHCQRETVALDAPADNVVPVPVPA